MFKSIITGVGAYLPKKVLTNNDLSKMIDTSDEWIVKRTGIKQRHIVADNQGCVDIAYEASILALENAGINASEIDGIIVATTTPDNAFPAVATGVGRKLGVTKGMAYDVSAACAGFIFALNNADNLIRLGQATNILVIGAEVMSGIMDWTDRNTCILFGDGAGAIVVSKTDSDNHILSTHIFSNGNHHTDLRTKLTPNNLKTSTCGIDMDGKAVYKFAVSAMSESVQIALNHNGYNIDVVDYLVPHQANIRIIESVGNLLGIAKEKTIISLPYHANTSAATVPLALDSAVKDGKFKRGHLIALTAMGAGFSWGSALLKWK